MSQCMLYLTRQVNKSTFLFTVAAWQSLMRKWGTKKEEIGK